MGYAFLCEVRGIMQLPQNQAIEYGLRDAYRVDAECINPGLFECSFIIDSPKGYNPREKIEVRINQRPN